MSTPDRDLSPVLPKKLRYIYNRILLNYLLLGLGAVSIIISLGQHEANAQLTSCLSSLPCPLWAILAGMLLLFLAATSLLQHKASAILGNSLLLITALGLIYAALAPSPALSYLYAACAATGLLACSLLYSSSRAMLIEMGPRHHAGKRLNLAECALPLGGIAAALCATLGYQSELALLIPSGLLALLSIVNIGYYIKMPAADLSAWQPETPAKALNSILSLLGYAILAAGAAFSLCTRQLIPACCDDVLHNPPSLQILVLLLAGFYLLGKIIHSIILSKGSTKKILALFVICLFIASSIDGTSGNTDPLFSLAALPITLNVISFALFCLAVGLIDSLLCTTASQNSTGLSLRLHAAHCAGIVYLALISLSFILA